MKKVLILTAFAALFTFVSCEKNAIEPLNIQDETSVSTDVADVETPDAFEREAVAESRGSFKIATITASSVATATSGDAGCTNYKYKNYAVNGASFSVVFTGDLNENIANVEGAISNLGMFGKSATFTIALPSTHTFGSTTVVFTTAKGTKISKKINVVGVKNGLFYGSTAYFLAAANVSLASGEAVTSATDYPASGNTLIIGGKRAVVTSYAIGKYDPKSKKQRDNKCTYDIFGASCNSGVTSVAWSGTSRFPSGCTAVVR